ncbi:hypothetical protein BCR32DRAFT_295491 [Anaeromyces robustus]|uniref:Uncharacterized protein n=1 Tax=Anaeromyces robustus TaxID=1754192 RepID=A0A1Y1WVT3_9FUNG|nr:hypothetical protein BCR32DRAFT_295491 [Anaeromyces robustus]|eukprot:ORX77669.1 hypothetical protein BCR32DRAFT_295491 [Anaeromyces robustus]
MDYYNNDKVTNRNSLSLDRLPLNENSYSPDYSHSQSSDISLNSSSPTVSATSRTSLNPSNLAVLSANRSSLTQNTIRMNILNSDNLQIGSNIFNINNNGLQVNSTENRNSMDILESPTTSFSSLSIGSPEINHSSISMERLRGSRLPVIPEDPVNDNSTNNSMDIENSRLEIPRTNRYSVNPRLSVHIPNSDSIEINNEVLYRKNETQRFFPKFGPCLGCFSFSSHTSFIISTLLIIILTTLELLLCLYYIIYDHNYYYIYIAIAVFIAVISNILLLIGVKKKNRILIRQFMIVYFLYIAVATLGTIRLIGRMYLYNNNDEFHKNQNEEFKLSAKENSNSHYKDYTDEEIKSYYQNQYFIRILLSVLLLIIVVYYYMINCSYIETIEEDIKKENIQKFEEAIY